MKYSLKMVTLIASLFLSACLALQAVAAEVSVETLLMQGGGLSDEVQVTIRTDGPYYLWSSYSQHKEVMTTQDIGKVQNISAGAGMRYEGWFFEFGAAYLRHTTTPIIAKEAIWYGFSETFGNPPFAKSYLETEYSYSSNTAYLARVGRTFVITDNFNVNLAYKVGSARTTFSIWSPTHNGGPVEDLAACGCLWIGSKKTVMDAVEIGFAYKF